MFKTLVGRGHHGFSSNRQQDVQEFILHIINIIEVTKLHVTLLIVHAKQHVHLHFNTFYYIKLNYDTNIRKLIAQRHSRHQVNPTDCFKFRVEERFQCIRSGKVKYTYRHEYLLPLPVLTETAINKVNV